MRRRDVLAPLLVLVAAAVVFWFVSTQRGARPLEPPERALAPQVSPAKSGTVRAEPRSADGGSSEARSVLEPVSGSESAEAASIEPTRDATLELEARGIPATLLHVVDAVTRNELSGVEVWLAYRSRGVLHPGELEDGCLARDVTSPITLPLPASVGDLDGTERVWARARDHAWGSLELSRELGGDYTLALTGGGELGVEVTGVHRSLKPFFLLRDPHRERLDADGALFRRHLEGDARFDLEGIPAGSYVATIEMGHYYRHPRMLDEREIVLEAGSTQRVTLDASAFEPPPTVEVRGELVVPVEWELDGMGLYLELVGQPTLDGEVQRYLPDDDMRVIDPVLASYAWSFGELQAGTYEARFNPLGQGFTFEAPAGGMPPLRLEVPPPATLEVSVVDEETGRPVEGLRVRWMPSRRELETGGTLNGARPLGSGRFSLRSPVGEVEVWCWSTSHRFRRELVSLVAGHQSIVVRTRPAEGILLRILDGETPLTLRDARVEISEVDGEGEGWLTDDLEHATIEHYVVSYPGVYRVEVRELGGGYALPPATELYVPAGSFVPLDLRVGP